MLSYYTRLAWKSLWRAPVLTLLMILALALGIGAFMTTYTVYYLMSGDPIPHKSDQLYAVQLDNWDPNSPPTESPKDVQPQLTYRDANALLDADTPARQQVMMYGSHRIVQPAEETAAPFQEMVRATTHGFFSMFDVPMRYGSPWGQAEDEAGARVVVLNEALNEQLFGGENSVGETLTLNDQPYRIVGVTQAWSPSPRFYHADVGAFEDAEAVFMPFSHAVDQVMMPSGNTNCWKPLEGEGIEAFLRSECVWVQFWAELPTREDAAAYLDYLNGYTEGQKALGRFPRPTNNYISDVMAWMDVNEVVSRDNRVLVRLAGLFLLVCVLNTIGLLLAKFLAKRPEIALRRAMGASRRAVFSQNMLEVAMIGVLGGLAGFVMAWGGLRLVERLYRGYERLVQLDLQLLIIAIAVAVLASMAAGFYPVWRTARLAPAGFLKTQ